ncbi:ThuA domain-containing protein [Saliterribacillus persicus]|uniref:Trehalose utilization protein n=1 Tax=Saliterribacillus persicus TaxID=930114 RepID=A0A368YE91_9BACI|nr:ThuA domain-containing protein [Saliterribacillus persicus]RCW77197.1 trehalose utilization protein [Saliterribacillus persicus]
MRMLAVLGDYYHDARLLRKALDRVLYSLRDQETIEQITIDYLGPKQLDDASFEEVDLIIIASENRINPEEEQVEKWMTEKIAKKIHQFVENGGGFLAWHSGFACYDGVETYLDMLKGSFDYHPEKHVEVTYHIEDDLFLNKNIQDFSFIDEHYFMHCDQDQTNVFLTSASEYGEQVAGWYHELGEGKVCCVVPAHTEEGLLHDSTGEILNGSIEWLIKE